MRTNVAAKTIVMRNVTLPLFGFVKFWCEGRVCSVVPKGLILPMHPVRKIHTHSTKEASDQTSYRRFLTAFLLCCDFPTPVVEMWSRRKSVLCSGDFWSPFGIVDAIGWKPEDNSELYCWLSPASWFDCNLKIFIRLCVQRNVGVISSPLSVGIIPLLNMVGGSTWSLETSMLSKESHLSGCHCVKHLWDRQSKPFHRIQGTGYSSLLWNDVFLCKNLWRKRLDTYLQFEGGASILNRLGFPETG